MPPNRSTSTNKSTDLDISIPSDRLEPQAWPRLKFSMKTPNKKLKKNHTSTSISKRKKRFSKLIRP